MRTQVEISHDVIKVNLELEGIMHVRWHDNMITAEDEQIILD